MGVGTGEGHLGVRTFTVRGPANERTLETGGNPSSRTPDRSPCVRSTLSSLTCGG